MQDVMTGLKSDASFEVAVAQELHTQRLSDSYRSGVMFVREDGQEARLNNTSLDIVQGKILWTLARRLRPARIVETGFGRGGSAAFLLAASVPWGATVTSIDPAYRHWAGDDGKRYLAALDLDDRHMLVEEPSEFVLADMARANETSLQFSYVDGSHHFDGTLIDFMFLDKMTDIGGVIAIDDAHAPAVRTLASYIAHNLPYELHYPVPRLLLCQKLAPLNRQWDHFKPFVCSPSADWNVHTDRPDQVTVPNATFDD